MESKWMRAMRRGDFAAAWAETDRIELRRHALERAGRFAWNPRYLLWNGEPFGGRRVAIRCNHGLGDTLQFLRYVPCVRALAREVVLLVQPPLVGLLSGCDWFGTVRDGWSADPQPDYDVEAEIMELAYAFRSGVETPIPAAPYLPLPRHDVAVGNDGKSNVGLLWAASDWDSRRSIPLAALAPLARVRGVRFHSLQQGAHGVESRTAPFPLEPLYLQTRSIERAAAALLALDLLITVDTMAAHLAGALGVPVWLMLPYRADWRWQTDRRDSPWYPTMRLFRQPHPGAWGTVGADLAGALQLLTPLRGAP